MATQNSINLPVTVNADGFTISGGTTERDLTVTGTDITITGSGSNVYTFPASTCTLSAANPLATDSLWDAKGDLVVGSGANTAARLAVGTDNYYLKVATDTAAWEALDISDDASPTLGGNLACGGYTLTGAGHGIADNQVLTVDDAAAADGDIGVFTANGLEGVTITYLMYTLLGSICAAADHGNLTATHTFDLTAAWVHTGTVDQNTTIQLTDPGYAGHVARFILTADDAGAHTVAFHADTHLDHAENWINSDKPSAMPATSGARMFIQVQRTQDANYYIGSYAVVGAKT